MSKKQHDPIIHAAIIQAAGAIVSGIASNRGKRNITVGVETAADIFAEALELVEAKYDAHLAKHHEK